VFVPGSSSLLFISDRDGGRDVYELALARSGHARGEPVRVTTGLSPNRIALSADGTRLAWSVSSESSNIWSVPIPDRDSISLAEATPITSGTQTIETMGISPDGAWLYYDSDARGNADIWRIPVRGGRAAGEAEQVTTDSAGEFSPDVSPDGREIVFHSFRNGNRDIYVAPAAGGSEQRVTTSPKHDWNPHWLPGGNSILFDNQEDLDAPLQTVARGADGTWGAPRAYPYRGRASMTRPSPDGRLVAFTAAGTWILDVAAKAARPVARTGGWLAWHPDGNGVYYVTSDSARSVIIRLVKIPGLEHRTVVYAPPTDRRTYRYGLTATRDRFYVPLFDSKADVWVAELARR
jgi:Tol biopolymer transport system component